jgi:hypothetical protein
MDIFWEEGGGRHGEHAHKTLSYDPKNASEDGLYKTVFVKFKISNHFNETHSKQLKNP